MTAYTPHNPFTGSYTVPAQDGLPVKVYRSEAYTIGTRDYVEVYSLEAGYPEVTVYDGRADGVRQALVYEERLRPRRVGRAVRALVPG